jgi:FecR protein
MKRIRVVVMGILLAGILLLQALPQMMAQEPGPDEAPGQDPPGRVARLNYSVGSVSLQPGGEGDWVQAVTNRPITTGDNLWADKDARAELHIGSTAIRMDSETSLTFLDLDDHTTQLKLSQGSVVLRVRHLDDGDILEVDTPNLAYNVQAAGEYRIDVNGDGNETDATVWHGRGEATGGGSSYVVVAGQRARFAGTDQLDHEIDQIPASDDFDNFAFSRDQHEDRSESANYISTEMTGYEDLDDHGSWHYVAGYGPVWTPAGVAADWAPYRAGHWAWIEPWGWTWVEDEPWGFAPFHYGRWAYLSSSWCWVPGPVVVRPVYAPALVAFVGGGGFSLSVGVGGGGVAWFPLGPREVYVPWYRTSRVYVNNVNITNTRVNVTEVTNVYNVYNTHQTNVTRITYVNQRGPAVTAVTHETFVNARPVGRNIVHVDERQIVSAPVSARVDVQPVRASVMGAGAPARFRPSATIVNRQVIATRTPTPPRASFEERRAPVNVRTEAPSTPQSAARTPNEVQRSQPGNPRMEEPNRPAQPAQQPQEAMRPGSRNEVPRPQADQGRGMPQAAPRAEQPPQPQRPEQPMQAARPDERSVPRPPQPGGNNRGSESSHPLVRSAPPVQDRPETQRSEEQKFGNWQQQRQNQRPAPQPQSRPQEQHAAPPQRAPEQRAPEQHGQRPQGHDEKDRH